MRLTQANLEWLEQGPIEELSAFLDTFVQAALDELKAAPGQRLEDPADLAVDVHDLAEPYYRRFRQVISQFESSLQGAKADGVPDDDPVVIKVREAKGVWEAELALRGAMLSALMTELGV